jgi:putative ABC transport system permease protein
VNTRRQPRGAFIVWRLLLLAQLRESPVRLIVALLAIALGVALGAAVYLVNNAALNEFGLAAKRLVGEADVVVRGPQGFPESLFTRLAGDPAVSEASPVLELEAALPGRRETLKILGLDPFRAATLQPALIGDIGDNLFALFQRNAIYLSSSAAQRLNVQRGEELPVIVGNSPEPLHVLGVLSEAAYSQDLGLMDIAAAQWAFGQIGRLNRVDLRLRPGVDVDSYRRSLERTLPVGVQAIAPQVERDRAITVTRAYRVNLNMLALVALWTGAFLVFSTQSLSVLRRRRSLALLRALGVTRGQLQRALVAEGAAIGMAGSILGVILGAGFAALALQFLTGDLGNAQLRAVGASLRASPLPVLAFVAMGTLVTSIGAWLPARTAARQPPAPALKGGDGNHAAAARSGAYLGAALLGVGAVLARLPAVAGLPLFGYAAIACLLLGAVMLIPTLAIKGWGIVPRTHRVSLDTAVAQLKENVGLSTLSLASIIVSFSLMVAMAIMVYSFRVSFEHWLGKLLPADLQLREPLGSDTAYWSAADQASLAATAGVSRIEFRRTRPLQLDPSRGPVTLIARGATDAQTPLELPLVRSTRLPLPSHVAPAWISEALQDLYGYQLGREFDLPLGGRLQRFSVAGVWRDYARTSGSIVISRQAYLAATGDDTANEGSIWLKDGANAALTEAGLRSHFVRGDSLEILTSTALRERSLRIFDRAFAVTYALEAIAVLIGLAGVSFAASSTALARRAEFGMLRHIGMLRRQVVGMLAAEGILLSAFGVAYGLVLGTALSLVLVYVVNRQSFNWSIDLAIPAWELALLSALLIAAAALTAIWSGRAATGRDAVQAVREDW